MDPPRPIPGTRTGFPVDGECGRRADELLSADLPALAAQEGIGGWRAWLRQADPPAMLSALRLNTSTGRPMSCMRLISSRIALHLSFWLT